jgi:hypothetical protein
LKIVGGTLIALGVVGIAGGGAALAVDGKGTCDLPGGQTQCPQVYDTATMGGVLVGLGAAAVVGGVVAIVVDQLRARKKPVAFDVTPLPSGAQVSLKGGW